MPNYKRYFLENRYIFITVVTYNRNHILIDNIDLLRSCIKQAKHCFDFELFASVILPEHFHILVKPANVKDFPKIIGTIKRNFTKSINEAYIEKDISKSRLKRNEQGVWQRRFYEHIIRDEDDLNKHLDYIHYNPVKHGYVKNVKDWAYSSFNKFVKLENYEPHWGSYSDIKHIEELDYD